MNKSKIVAISLTILVLSMSLVSVSQTDSKIAKQKKPFSERFFVGGALGFSVGTYSSLIDISPIFGYAVTEDFIAGIGLTYKYYKYKDYFYQLDEYGNVISVEDFKSNMYGFSIWSRYYLSKIGIPFIENIFLHAEVEPLTFINKYSFNPNGSYMDPWGGRYIKADDRINLTGVFLGGGLRQMIGGRSYLYIEVVWDLNEDLYSPYSNPRIRIGVAAGF